MLQERKLRILKEVRTNGLRNGNSERNGKTLGYQYMRAYESLIGIEE